MIDAVLDAQQFSAGAVRSALAAPLGPPSAARSVGPFVVVAHALPWAVAPGELAPDVDIRPHPHIGLAAVTYMLQGHVTHRDSLGSRYEAAPGGVNYMITGRGAVHSERFDRLRTLGGTLELLQVLLALPDGAEDVDPSFVAVPPANVPEEIGGGAAVRQIVGAGTALAFPAPIFLHDVRLDPDGRYVPPNEAAERAIYVAAGTVDVDGTEVRAHQTALVAGPTVVRAAAPARLVAFGGPPVGPRYMWWNFIHSSLERIEAAKAAWRAGQTPLPHGDTEAFTPAPADGGRPIIHLNGPRATAASRA